MKAFVYTQTDALRRYLGVEGKEPLPEGVYVSKAFKKFPLYEAGVRAGDMLHSFNNHALDNFGHARVPWNPDSRVTLSDLMSRVTYDQYNAVATFRRSHLIHCLPTVGHLAFAQYLPTFP